MHQLLCLIFFFTFTKTVKVISISFSVPSFFLFLSLVLFCRSTLNVNYCLLYCNFYEKLLGLYLTQYLLELFDGKILKLLFFFFFKKFFKMIIIIIIIMGPFQELIFMQFMMSTSIYQWAGKWGSVPGQVMPQTQKMVLDASLLNTQL